MHLRRFLYVLVQRESVTLKNQLKKIIIAKQSINNFIKMLEKTQWYLESTSGVFERARQQVSGAVILEMNLQVLPGQNGRLAAMRTRHGEASALGVMRAEGVEDELLAAVATCHQPFGALAELMLAEVSPLHLHAALVLAVQRLVAARSSVFLQKKS